MRFSHMLAVLIVIGIAVSLALYTTLFHGSIGDIRFENIFKTTDPGTSSRDCSIGLSQNTSWTFPGTQKQGNIHWVIGSGSSLLNRVLIMLRNFVIMCNGSLENVSSAPGSDGVIRRFWANEMDTLYQLQNESSIMTVALPWIDDDDDDVADSRNLLITEYYRWG